MPEYQKSHSYYFQSTGELVKGFLKLPRLFVICSRDHLGANILNQHSWKQCICDKCFQGVANVLLKMKIEFWGQCFTLLSVLCSRHSINMQHYCGNSLLVKDKNALQIFHNYSIPPTSHLINSNNISHIGGKALPNVARWSVYLQAAAISSQRWWRVLTIQLVCALLGV